MIQERNLIISEFKVCIWSISETFARIILIVSELEDILFIPYQTVTRFLIFIYEASTYFLFCCTAAFLAVFIHQHMDSAFVHRKPKQ